MNLDKLLEKCLPVGKMAGDIVRNSWDSAHEIVHKGAIDLVTETDKAVENFLKAELGALLPEAGFLGEESGGDQARLLGQPWCWVVDPVDGTTNYAHGVPVVGVSIALCQAGAPVLGIIEAPMLGGSFHAIKGGGAFCDGKPLRVSRAERPIDCLVATGFPYDISPQLAKILKRLEKVLPATQGLRRPGAASIDLAWVAAGKFDAFYEDGLKPWDMAAGWLLVLEAGGKLSDFNGGAAGWGKSLLATNGLVHAGFVELLKE